MTTTTAQRTVRDHDDDQAQETTTGTMTMATALRTTTADIPPCRSGATNGPHGHGTYMFSIVGPDNAKDTHLWTMGTGPDTLEVVFVYCGDDANHAHPTSDLPPANRLRCGTGALHACRNHGRRRWLEITDQPETVYSMLGRTPMSIRCSLNGWNTIRPTPDGAYADENPAILPAVGLNMTLLTMPAALLARRRFEEQHVHRLRWR